MLWVQPINGLYKTELIKPRGPGRTVKHVEIATSGWVDWFTRGRAMSSAETFRLCHQVLL